MNKSISVFTIIRIAMVAVLLVFVILFQIGSRDSNSSLDSVTEKVTASIDLQGMEESNNRMIRKFYGLNPEDYEGITLYAPASNMNAEELLVIKLKDASQADAATQAIQTRLETQMASFDGYGIEQYAMLEDHILDVRGNFILYVVHPDAGKADQAFRKAL